MKNIEEYTYLNNENLINEMNSEYMKNGICCDSVTNNVLVFVSARFRRIAKLNTAFLSIIKVLEKTTNGMKKQYLLDYCKHYKLKNCCSCFIDEEPFLNKGAFYPYLLIKILEFQEQILVECNNLSMFDCDYNIEIEKNILLLIQDEIIKYIADKYLL